MINKEQGTREEKEHDEHKCLVDHNFCSNIISGMD